MTEVDEEGESKSMHGKDVDDGMSEVERGRSESKLVVENVEIKEV